MAKLVSQEEYLRRVYDEADYIEQGFDSWEEYARWLGMTWREAVRCVKKARTRALINCKTGDGE